MITDRQQPHPLPGVALGVRLGDSRLICTECWSAEFRSWSVNEEGPNPYKIVGDLKPSSSTRKSNIKSDRVLLTTSVLTRLEQPPDEERDEEQLSAVMRTIDEALHRHIGSRPDCFRIKDHDVYKLQLGKDNFCYCVGCGLPVTSPDRSNAIPTLQAAKTLSNGNLMCYQCCLTFSEPWPEELSHHGEDLADTDEG